MGIDIRLPTINGKTESEQLAQIKSYLYQFAGQLQWALGTVEAGNGSNVAPQKTTNGSSSKKEDPTSNFNELKALIIKSADVVDAFYDSITKLIDKNNRYVAQSVYGTFEEKTNNALYADGTGLTQQIENVQKIFDENGNIRADLLVNGHIFSGIIEYAKDGEAIVGIEIGQTTTEKDKEGNEVRNFYKFARFTAERLEFYDAMVQDKPVAYISNYMLVITNAWVKGSLELGIDNSCFEFDTTNGIALRPV